MICRHVLMPPFCKKLADAILPEKTHREFNFALLDLGALVCRYVKPNCNLCPLVNICDYANSQQGAQEGETPFTSRIRQARMERNISLVKLANKAKVSKLTNH